MARSIHDLYCGAVLVVDLPPDMPLGAAELTITPQPVSQYSSPSAVNPAWKSARAKLIAGGALNTAHHAPPGSMSLSNADLERFGQLQPGARTSDDIIDEERGAC